MSTMTRPSRIARSGDEWLTVDEVCAELRVTRRSFERWCRLGKGPRVKRLAGNGPIRIKRAWLNDWLEGDAA
jgi:excisionase family DNA binding protein